MFVFLFLFVFVFFCLFLFVFFCMSHPSHEHTRLTESQPNQTIHNQIKLILTWVNPTQPNQTQLNQTKPKPNQTQQYKPKMTKQNSTNNQSKPFHSEPKWNMTKTKWNCLEVLCNSWTDPYLFKIFCWRSKMSKIVCNSWAQKKNHILCNVHRLAFIFKLP